MPIHIQGEIRHDRYIDSQGLERFFSVVIASFGHELKSLDRPEADASAED